MLLVDEYSDAFLFQREYDLEELNVLVRFEDLVDNPWLQIKFIDYLDDSDEGGAGCYIDYIIINKQSYLRFQTGLSKDKPDEELILDLARIWEGRRAKRK